MLAIRIRHVQAGPLSAVHTGRAVHVTAMIKINEGIPSELDSARTGWRYVSIGPIRVLGRESSEPENINILKVKHSITDNLNHSRCQLIVPVVVPMSHDQKPLHQI